MTAFQEPTKVANGHHVVNGTHEHTYSVLQETQKALETLLRVADSQIPPEIRPKIEQVSFTNAHEGVPDFPVPLKENEATSALKAVEAGIASAIADIALGQQDRKATVDLERASCFLFSTYLATIGGFDKGDPKSKALLKGILLRELITMSRTKQDQTPISWPLNRISIDAYRQTYTRPRMPANTSIFTVPSKRPPL